VAPSEAKVTLAFGSTTVSFGAPIGTIDTAAGTVTIGIVGTCGTDVLISLPGEIGTLSQQLTVPGDSVEKYWTAK
jgi:hypothetical protein